MFFGVCIDSAGYQASLEVGKLYPVIPDPEAGRHGYIRVVDESAESYGYASQRFFVLEIPVPLAKVLTARLNISVQRSKRSVQRTR